MNDNYFQRVGSSTPTSFWINNVTREEAQAAIEAGATGCTQNPSYPWKMLNSDADSAHANEILDGILAQEPVDDKAIETLQCELVRDICQRFLPMYKSAARSPSTGRAAPIH